MRQLDPYRALAGPEWWVDISRQYIRSLARKNRRPRTLVAYSFEFAAFGRWLQLDKVLSSSGNDLTGRDIEDFQDDRASDIAPKTIQVSSSALRGLFRWAAAQEPPLCSPTLWMRVTSPRVPAKKPRPIPQADLEKILVHLEAHRETVIELRTRALFLLLLSSGARIFEALSLDRDQIQDGMATVISKGGAEGVLLFGEVALAACANYIAVRTDSCPALFGSHRLTQPVGRLSFLGAQHGWFQLADLLGLKRWTSHMIRHTCATELLRQGVDSLVIAKHLRHKGLQHVQNYAEVGLASRQQVLRTLDERMRRAS